VDSRREKGTGKVDHRGKGIRGNRIKELLWSYIPVSRKTAEGELVWASNLRWSVGGTLHLGGTITRGRRVGEKDAIDRDEEAKDSRSGGRTGGGRPALL